jgi:phage shock protein E
MPYYFKPIELVHVWRHDGRVAWQYVSKRKKIIMIEKMIRNSEGTIVDVRTKEEFERGHAAGSVNIPLNELTLRIKELKSLKSPVILCCASGGRSAMAHNLLTRQGITCHDAGSWHNVNYFQNQNVVTP